MQVLFRMFSCNILFVVVQESHEVGTSFRPTLEMRKTMPGEAGWLSGVICPKCSQEWDTNQCYKANSSLVSSSGSNTLCRVSDRGWITSSLWMPLKNINNSNVADIKKSLPDLKRENGGWRDGSAGKGTHCSWRPNFDFQNVCWAAHSHL